MTDNEIKKALEICIMGDCEICSCRCGSVGDCRDALNKKSLDLINRLQAENERLRAECGNQSVLWSKHYGALFETAKETTKAEAYKEFANRLKEKYGYYDWENKCIVYPEDEIDNLLKEKVGEDK